MRRDMDLIRELMLKLETVDLPYRGQTVIDPRHSTVAVPPHDPKVIGYHLDLLDQAGFLQDAGSRAASGIVFAGLSLAGHEFVESVRGADAWAGAKDRAGKVGSFALGFVTNLAKAWAKDKAAKLGYM